MNRGEQTIEEWTLHCPACGRPVTVKRGQEAVACPHCHEAFVPEAIETAAWKKPGADAHPLADPDDGLVGARLGRWRLRRLLGRGGMGRVYEAHEEGGRGKRRVAIKVLSEDLARDPSFVKRFHRESRVLASLSHPHIVEVVDRGEDDGRIYFAMEYVRGESLRRLLEQGPLDVEEVVRLAGEIASALTYAHERGVVHRDLKPENVLLDEEGRVHLVDFGLSRLAGDGGAGATTMLTRTDVILGTYEYMAPEQRRGEKDLDARSDVFALGVMLYEMLTGKLPHGRFAPPSQARADVPPSFDPVVNKALAPERVARYASAEALHHALRDGWVQRSTVPVEAPPPPRRKPAKARVADAYLSELQLQPLRRVIKHVDVLSALDRVLGILLVAAFFGVSVFSAFEPVFRGVPAVGGVVLLIAGILFLNLGGRLRGMSTGSRDSQLTASVLLLFFPPFLTLMGLYGLVLLSTDRARRAFALGRKALEGPQPVVAARVIAVPPPIRRAAPWLLLRVLFIASVLWTLYVGFVVLAGGAGGPDYTFTESWRHLSAERQFTAKISIMGAIVSLLYVIAAFRGRKIRRGLGLALTAFLLFAACTTVLTNLHRVHTLASVHAPAPRMETVLEHGSLLPTPPLPRLEIRR